MWGGAFFGWPVERADLWRVPRIRGGVAPLYNDLAYIRYLQRQLFRPGGDHFDAWMNELPPSPIVDSGDRPLHDITPPEPPTQPPMEISAQPSSARPAIGMATALMNMLLDCLQSLAGTGR